MRNQYKIDGNILVVYNRKDNRPMLFDIEDINILNLSNYTYRIDANGYVSNRILGYAHRLVMNAAKDLQVDHIDGIKSDNRKCNLRLVNNQQNSFNKQAKGYYWAKHAKKWGACIALNGKTIFLGYYKMEAEARQAYLEAKKIYHSTAPLVTQ